MSSNLTPEGGCLLCDRLGTTCERHIPPIRGMTLYYHAIGPWPEPPSRYTLAKRRVAALNSGPPLDLAGVRAALQVAVDEADYDGADSEELEAIIAAAGRR